MVFREGIHEKAHRERKFTITSYRVSREENFSCSESEMAREVPDIQIETYDDTSSSTNYFNKLVENTVVTDSGISGRLWSKLLIHGKKLCTTNLQIH
ncbi:MAG: hypothetical protein ACRD47_10815 [Nitrososphaeraceae archaeon]